MSGSPVLNLRRVQMAVKLSTGQDVSTVDLCLALLGQMGTTTKISLDRTSLKVHHSRLRNWQIADSILRASIIANSARPSQADLVTLYATYCTEAESAGLVPMAPATFRLRSFSSPSPEGPHRRGRLTRVF
jgi:hypothetical protein